MKADNSSAPDQEKTNGAFEDPLISLAAERFGILSLTPLQRFVIANTLENINQLVVLPTGGGKSVCFQLPALLLEGATLVVVPLLSLLQDQERRLVGLGMKCEVLRGGQEEAEREGIFKRLTEGFSRIVFATPEILENELVLSRLRESTIAHFVIDEAHCISEWGKTFRPSYRRLGKIIDRLEARMVSAFTATASPPIIRNIGEQIFQGIPWKLVDDLPDRPNIFYRVVPALAKNAVLTNLTQRLAKPMVVFTRSRKSAELSARLLRRRLGTEEIFFYHAGLTRAERRRVEEWFFASKTGILCSTSAYGMGIDKPDIRSIIHRDVPPSVEAYVQESGRAGRDGEPANAILIHGYEDEEFLSAIESPLALARFRHMYGYTRQNHLCRRKYLLQALGYPLAECAGCDVCRNETELERGGEKEILHVVKKAPRRFSKRELVALLAGKTTYEVLQHDLDRKRYFGMLAAWEREDIEEAVEILENRGNIAVSARGFFKFRYRAGKKIISIV